MTKVKVKAQSKIKSKISKNFEPKKSSKYKRFILPNFFFEHHDNKIILVGLW